MLENLFGNLQTLLIFIGMLLATVAVSWAFNFVFQRFVKREIKRIKADPTGYQFVRHFITGIIYLIGVGWALLTLPHMKTVAHTLLAGAGVVTLIAGLASQQALSNITSGLFLVIFKPFRVNDRIKFRDTFIGIVEDITLRHTIIRDLENNRIVIPNSIISNEVLVNLRLGDSRICKIIDIGIAYTANIDRAQEIIRDEVLKHPLRVDPRSPEDIQRGIEEVPVRVTGLGNSSVNLRTWAWAKDPASGFVLNCDLLKSIKLRFDAEGIEIPYNYQNVIIKSGDINLLTAAQPVPDKDVQIVTEEQ